MKTLKNMTGDSLEQMIDYKVVDQNGDSIGTLHSLWSDPTTGAVEFLGVKTGWIFGQNHVVPADKAELDETANVVRLPFTEAFVKDAPAVSAEAEITEEDEDKIYQYYSMARGGSVSDAPGNNQPGVKYDETASETREAIGGAGIANASEAGTGGTQFGGPTSTDADATLSGVGRLRRTSRPDSAFQSSGGVPNVGANASDDIGQIDASSRVGASTASTGSPASANMFGSTGSFPIPAAASPTGATSTDASTDLAPGVSGRPVTDSGDANAGLTGTHGTHGSHLDPITGEPGSHPVGTGAGALAGGAAGAAIGGAIGGPIGAPLGAVVGVVAGAVGGGYAGKGIAEAVNPTDENAYWQGNFHHASYKEEGYDYSDYSPAYRAGYEGFERHAASGKDYSEVEGDLEQDYNRNRGGSKLTWDKAKAATRDAWDRLKNKTSEATRD